MNQKEKEQYYYNHKKKEINIDKIFSIIGEILQIVLYPVCMVGWAMPVFIIYKNLVHLVFNCCHFRNYNIYYCWYSFNHCRKQTDRYRV